MRRFITFQILLLWVVLFLFPTSAWTQDNDDCLYCHERDSGESERLISGAEFDKSIHGRNLACVDCHPSAEDDDHTMNDEVIPVQCRECHSRDTDMDGVWSSLLSFRIKGHGKGSLGEFYSRERCLDCHQGQAAHGEKAPLTGADCHICHGPDVAGRLALGNFHSRMSYLGPSPWRVLGDGLYLLCLAAALLVFILGWIKRIRYWRMGGQASRWDRPWRRLVGGLVFVLGQRKNFRRKMAGYSHYLLFLGVTLPLLVIFVTQFRFSTNPPIAGVISFFLDMAGLGLLVGVITALYRRSRYPGEFPHEEKGNFICLVVLGLIALSGFFIEGSRLSATSAYAWTSPVGSLASTILPASGLTAKIIWRIHFILVLVFLAMTPYTRLRHILTASINIYFRNLGAKGEMKTVPVDKGEQFGLSSPLDLTWKDILETDACLSCGRCSEVCPAARTEKDLSPMEVIRSIGHQAEAGLRNGGRPAANALSLINEGLTENAVWDCTTCQACQEACPVLVEHVSKLTGLRRGLVLNEGRLPKEAAKVLRNVEVFGDPTGEGAAYRSEWLRTIDRVNSDRSAKVLFWVGCQGAFHPRGHEVASSMLRLLERTGEKFTFLGDEELCCGDPVRRLGGEDVFQDLARRNIARFKDRGIETIITFCPHCYNTLKHDYPDFNGGFTVEPAVQWILRHISTGKLKVKRKWPHPLTFHDPCYLGRINDLAETSRQVLQVATDAQLHEMPESKERTFCCGAGGGRMWLHEAGLRINQMRAEQCIETGAAQVATACPYCLVMLEDGLTGREDQRDMSVLDLIEIVEWVTR